MQDDISIEKYEYYEKLFDPTWAEGWGPRKPRANHKPKKTGSQIISELTDDTSDVDLGFSTTYQPSRYESGWLLSSLAPFYDEALIIDVLSLVKGGKEASVYCCEAHPATGSGLLAAKVYRPRMFRNLRNDKMYRQGREVLTSEGRPAGKQAGTIARAIRNKTNFGLHAAHTSWLMHEYTALERLYQAGAAVPRPVAPGENALLMSYHGDSVMAAPTLNTVDLDRGEAQDLFQEVLRNVDLMLGHDLVHGDLSAYNILYWEGEIVIIDFPQVVNVRTNPKARSILRRDLQRICDYFAGQGVDCEPQELFEKFWQQYVGELDPQNLAADWSRIERELAESAEGIG
jgi:RIO kinase 1